MTAAASLVVAETFGPTYQGEGPSTGRLASFLRLGGCNLACSWCDEARTWDASRFDLRAELTRRPVDEIAAELLAHDTPLVVITGGEPLLHQQQPAWSRLLGTLDDAGRVIEIETNGTVLPTPVTRRHARLNVSPKLAHSGDPAEQRIHPEALRALVTADSVFKFVARDPSDLDEIDALVDELWIPRTRVWVMPEGTRPDETLARARQLADPVLARGWNLTLRAHVLLWPDESRGR